MPSTPTSTARPAVRPARDAFWDMVKALLIFLVILGHSVQFILYPADKGIALVFADSLFKGIYLFHMPCFIAISGYFAAASLRKKGHAALLPTLRRLLLPTCAAALLIIITRYYQGRLTWPHTLHDASTFLWFLTVAAECILCYHLMMWQKHLAYRKFSSCCSPPSWRCISPILPNYTTCGQALHNSLTYGRFSSWEPT